MKCSLEKARTAQRESKYVDFKEQFDVQSNEYWCEIVKDIVAIANTGGGCIIFGLYNNGTPSDWDPSPILNLDAAKVTDKIAKYTDVQFSDFAIEKIHRDGYTMAVLQIDATQIPIVFTRPGTYQVTEKKQNTAFSEGTVYFRHGAKSEPANREDLRDFIDRAVEDVRRSWLSNIKKVVEAPVDLPVEVRQTADPSAPGIRLTDDPNAPEYRKVDPDVTHPYRLKELVERLNSQLDEDDQISMQDILYLRKVHKIYQNPEFYHDPQYSTPQYSESFAEWLLEQYKQDPQLFKKAKQQYYKKS